MAALRYAIEEGLVSLWRGRRSAWLATGTIAVALFVLGASRMVTANLERMVAEWRAAAELSVFVAVDLSDPDSRALTALLTPGPVVASHEFVSQAEALARFKQMFGDLAPTADRLGGTMLPASFEVRLRPDAPAEAIDAFAARLRQTPGVSDVRFDRDWLNRLLVAVAVIRRVGWGLGALLTLAAALTVANVVRLALYARHDEIAIMRLVGAPPAYVRGPFIAEGMLQGGLGGLVAVVVLAGGFLAVRGSFLVPLASALNMSAVQFLSLTTCVYLMLGGMAVGCLGGILATRSD